MTELVGGNKHQIVKTSGLLSKIMMLELQKVISISEALTSLFYNSIFHIKVYLTIPSEVSAVKLFSVVPTIRVKPSNVSKW